MVVAFFPADGLSVGGFAFQETMMAQSTLKFEASPRSRAGKGAARQARRDGLTPAVIYGGGQDPLNITLSYKDLFLSLHEPGFFSRLIEITVEGKPHLVLCRDVQTHPVNDRPEHVDFLRVTEKTRVSVAIPVQFVNEDSAIGLKKGGVLNVVRYEVECFCRADRIPDHLEIDLKSVDVGESIHISAVPLPDGVEPTITDRDFTVATIVAPRGLKAAGDADEGQGSGDENAES